MNALSEKLSSEIAAMPDADFAKNVDAIVVQIDFKAQLREYRRYVSEQYRADPTANLMTFTEWQTSKEAKQ